MFLSAYRVPDSLLRLNKNYSVHYGWHRGIMILFYRYGNWSLVSLLQNFH